MLFRSKPVVPPPSTAEMNNGKRDMRGPGFDIGNLGGGGIDIASILSTLNSQQQGPPSVQDDEISDIISIGSEVRDLELQPNPEKKRRGRKPKKELVL